MKINKKWHEVKRDEVDVRDSAPAAYLRELQQRGDKITGALILDEVEESKDSTERRMSYNDTYGNTWAVIFLGTPSSAMVRIKDTMDEEGDQWEYDGESEWCSRSRQPLDAWIFRPENRQQAEPSARIAYDQWWCEEILGLLGHEFVAVAESEEVQDAEEQRTGL